MVMQMRAIISHMVGDKIIPLMKQEGLGFGSRVHLGTMKSSRPSTTTTTTAFAAQTFERTVF